MIRVVTDSSAVLPADEIERYRLVVVPLTVMWDGEAYRDGVDITYQQFAARVGRGEVPKTSAPSPGEYAQACEQALAGAEALVVITPPAEVSVAFSNATLAAQATDPRRVRVLDSRSAAAGQGLVVLEAARAAMAGGGLDAVAERAAFVAERVGLVATLQRLDYLRRSGRVPSVAALAGDALHLNPVFRFSQGRPTPISATRGGRRAAERLLEELERARPEAPARLHAFVFHSSRAEHAAELRSRVLSAEPGAEVLSTEISAAVAAHLGPGLLGLAWWWEPLR